MRRFLAICAIAISLGFVVGACGSKSSTATSTPAGAATTSPTTGNVRLAKTRFVLHAGLAFGAFHRWIYKPLRAGELAHPLAHKAAVVKAALAGGFTYHELGLALHYAQADPTLSKLVSPITALQNRISGVSSGLHRGNVDTAGITDANGSIASIHQQSASAGQPITETTPNAP